jgi:hypothetical protein
MTEEVSQKRLREIRDMAIRYVYEHGGAACAVASDKLDRALGLSPQEAGALRLVWVQQGLSMGGLGHLQQYCLGPAGQEEAERLGVEVPMRAKKDEAAQQHVVIHAGAYSVVQVGGSHTTQTGSVSIEASQTLKLLDEIERALPTLDLEPTIKEEAKGWVATLREMVTKKMPAVGARAVGAALDGSHENGGQRLGREAYGVFGRRFYRRRLDVSRCFSEGAVAADR